MKKIYNSVKHFSNNIKEWFPGPDWLYLLNVLCFVLFCLDANIVAAIWVLAATSWMRLYFRQYHMTDALLDTCETQNVLMTSMGAAFRSIVGGNLAINTLIVNKFQHRAGTCWICPSHPNLMLEITDSRVRFVHFGDKHIWVGKNVRNAVRVLRVFFPEEFAATKL